MLLLSVYVSWPDDNFSTRVYGEVDLGPACPGSTTTTTTAVPYPTTTTALPYPTTTTCAWCNTTTTYPTTTTCEWCNTTTTYPTTTTCEWCDTTTTYSKPPACHQVVATPGDGRAMVRWTAPDASGVSAITDYVVTPYFGSSALARVVKAASTSGVVSGLVNGRTYRFTVTAETESGTGPPSDPTDAVTIGVPTAPTAVTAGRACGQGRSPLASTDGHERLTDHCLRCHAVPQRRRSTRSCGLRTRDAGEDRRLDGRTELHVPCRCREPPRCRTKVGLVEHGHRA